MIKNDLVNYLIVSNILKTRSIIKAFKKIDRADFVLSEYRSNPYKDIPLPIGYGQTISQPTTVTFMLELLQSKEGEKILDIGSGSGWVTALLSLIAGNKGRVWGLEIIPELVEFGNANLAKYNFKNSKIIQAGEKLGLVQEAPFDKIIVSAAGGILPDELVNQLKIGGRMVIPINNSIWQIDKISKNNIKRQEFPGFAFVPLK